MRYRFKGLDLIDRVPNELWTEVRDIVQETGIKTILMEKKCKKAKWLSGEALQKVVKRREAKSKGEKERYKNLNAEFQGIERRDKKAFLSDQCKEIQENNRMEKNRALFTPADKVSSLCLNCLCKQCGYAEYLLSFSESRMYALDGQCLENQPTVKAN